MCSSDLANRTNSHATRSRRRIGRLEHGRRIHAAARCREVFQSSRYHCGRRPLCMMIRQLSFRSKPIQRIFAVQSGQHGVAEARGVRLEVSQAEGMRKKVSAIYQFSLETVPFCVLSVLRSFAGPTFVQIRKKCQKRVALPGTSDNSEATC